MSDPHAAQRTCVTIKVPESKRYAADNPWFVFEGTPENVREQIITTFDMSDTEGLSLFEVTLNAQRFASNVGGAAQSLGGTILDKGKGATQDQPLGGGQQPAKSEEDDPAEPIKAMIEAATSREGLKKIWAENKAVFDSTEGLMDLWKAKGKSLPA